MEANDQASQPENVTPDLATRLKSAFSKQESDEALRRLLKGEHPLDIAGVIGRFTRPEILRVFDLLDDASAMEVLDRADAATTRFLAENVPLPRIAEFLRKMPNRKTARNLAESAPKAAAALLKELEVNAPEDMQELRQLLSYKENTAGRMTTKNYVRLSASLSLQQAFDAFRDSEASAETASDLFVTEPFNGNSKDKERLVGVVSLREMMRARLETRFRPQMKVADIMTRNPITATVDTPQNEVANLMSKYHFLALPVIEKDGSLVGVVQIDDVIDALDESYLRGDSAEIERSSPARLARMRLPWLLGTMGIELCAGLVINHFDDVLKKVILLASFMPVISAISGNVGLQAAAIVVRGIDTGHVSLKTWSKQLAKELVTTALMAVACGLVLGTIGVIWSKHLFFGIVIGGAMAMSMLTAACMGTIIPILSKKLGFDPATTAGPFETAFQDIVGFGVFLWLASLLMQWLR